MAWFGVTICLKQDESIVNVRTPTPRMTTPMFLMLAASVVTALVHDSSSVMIATTRLAPGRTVLGNTLFRKDWKATATFELPPIRFSDLTPFWRELISLYVTGEPAALAYGIKTTVTQFELMLKLATKLLTKFFTSCHSVLDLCEASTRTANSMLHCEHSTI